MMDKLNEWLKAKRGRKAELATECGVTHSAISQWSQVPVDRVADVSRVTGIPPHELRPDLADIFLPRSKQEAAE